MHKVTGFSLVSAAVVGGFFMGQACNRDGADTEESAVANVEVPSDIERRKVPLGGDAKGASDAVVNIVEFSDFECPFCGRVNPTLEQLLKDYEGKVRVFFKHYPLPMHPNAPLAAQAALAASEQGKFWPMHDKLFENRQALQRADLDRYAQELGLNMDTFKKALDAQTYKSRVDADMALAGQLGVRGTPAFFINGRFLSGAQPVDAFKTIIDQELAIAQKMMAEGLHAREVYAKLMEKATTGPATPPVPSPAALPPVPKEVYKVEVGDAPTKGGDAPKVTIVEFSEFQCPYCNRVGPTLQKILETYKDDVQIAFKHLPLPFHNNAEAAALASEAAREQGKFWPLHDKMFANQGALDQASLERYAQELGLDMGRFKAAMKDPKLKARLEADKKQAATFGAGGTPTFFVNGRKLVGAQPFEAFKTLIDEEIKKADEKLAAGTSRKALYAAIIKEGLDKAAPPPARPGAPSPSDVYKVPVDGAPSKGPRDALVTIVVFSDFQCPFCSRIEPTLTQVMDTYKGKVRVVWRDFPLNFHKDAVPAAIVARVAGEQGKFWQMHEKLFANQSALDRASLEKYARELGLNMGKVKSALDSKKYEKEIQADMALGSKVGVQGTPASFVNGRFVSGAQPFEAWKAVIDQELAKAEALVKKGTAKGKLYETIMKEAKAQVAAAPSGGVEPGGPGPGGPEMDKTVYKVEVGKAPSRGPKNAPITVVVFSDFECPYCSKVEPNIAQLEKDFPGKIKVVWKDFPLSFHQNARPAAIAARVAGEEGKFWQMHEKLFQNQRALDRASLERYAQEIGLDVAKLKNALDTNKYNADIDADMKSGAAVGVQGTPATFINGRKVSGAVPYPTFKAIVEQELAKARKGT